MHAMWALVLICAAHLSPGCALVIGFRRRSSKPIEATAPQPSNQSTAATTKAVNKTKSEPESSNHTKTATKESEVNAARKEEDSTKAQRSVRNFFGRKEEEPTVTSLKPMVLKPRVIHFNLMVAGLSGLGKVLSVTRGASDVMPCAQTTAVNALFKAWTEPQSDTKPPAKPKSQPTADVDTSRVFERFDKKSNTVLRVMIVDTPGFGNNIDNGESVAPIANFVAASRRKQYRYSQREEDEDHPDDLVHACVYFMSPHRFLEIDRFFLKHVQAELAVIPVIAKSDTLTNEELAAYRSHLRQQFEKEKIETYSFPERKTFTDPAAPRKRELPTDCLAIIARDGTYPWGQSRVYDPDHSDFDLLRDSLLSEHTEKLIQLARSKYYVYRANKIQRAKRLSIVKTLFILAFSAHSLATRTSLFPFVEDFFNFMNAQFAKDRDDQAVTANPKTPSQLRKRNRLRP